MEIKPFKAYRFNEEVVGNAGDCIAPPYDVIDEELQENLYKKNDHNIVRIIRGKLKSTDDDGSNQYTRAGNFLNRWIEENALKQDDKDSIYAYVQDFDINGQTIRRFSFIAQGKVEPFGKTVMPHEQTLSGPKVDRLNLQKACNATFGLVYMLYNDPEQVADNIIEKASNNQPLVELVDENGVKHMLFKIDNDSDINAIKDMMADKSVLIADGHHRYTTAVNYYNETKAPERAYTMLAFSNMDHEGLLVLATHRLVSNLKEFEPNKLMSKLEKNFDITTYDFSGDEEKTTSKHEMLKHMKDERSKGNIAFGIYTGKDHFSVASLKNPQAMDEAAPDKSQYWRELNVSVLHKLILEELLGIGEKQLEAKTNLDYIKDRPEAVDKMIKTVDEGKAQAAFFTNPEKLKQIMQVAKQGEIMPQKSTYFYPKVYTGLTINKF